MGMQLPGELISLLDLLGYSWPEADEEKLFEMGQAWIRFSDTLSGIVGEANTTAATVWTENTGRDVQAFQRWWTEQESPIANLSDGVIAAILTGTGLIICGIIVLALKISVIVQLTILAIEIAQAVATAAVTFGASLAEIPVFQQLARTIINNLFQDVIWQLLDG